MAELHSGTSFTESFIDKRTVKEHRIRFPLTLSTLIFTI
ncbi:hypothetical protein B8V81_2332 [Paenibacillus pasadenensis]|uniref:Uncharacterized protein n=1 Tax=Paenibacillus pasadenensis TaxID=217090 RepID=A0A2N5N0P0_9BACL|nr:hypothetical protein B8V81_2332 [Paenibacillus pasadenensis]